jgi:hypothetical protein
MNALNLENITPSQFLNLFRQFSRTDQLFIAKKITELTFEERWDLLDSELPDIDMSDEEIMAEIKEVRYGKTENI